ncbi:MAG: hypothetical protein BWY75_00499 [bacterium ADurb.Bin425]|nr:MAG: hypothetical protein BWY75_00499 [bacterium ADurb.Bin425]
MVEDTGQALQFFVVARTAHVLLLVGAHGKQGDISFIKSIFFDEMIVFLGIDKVGAICRRGCTDHWAVAQVLPFPPQIIGYFIEVQAQLFDFTLQIEGAFEVSVDIGIDGEHKRMPLRHKLNEAGCSCGFAGAALT